MHSQNKALQPILERKILKEEDLLWVKYLKTHALKQSKKQG
jgi:hypothetical protein